jgi:four helix bundle protein
MGPHEKLQVWNRSMDYVKEVYELTNRFPDTERYGLTSQMRRAAVSIPCNIAEGAARKTRKEYMQFLYVSRGSVSELETLLGISKRLNLIETSVYEAQRAKCETLSKMLTSLIYVLKGKEGNKEIGH